MAKKTSRSDRWCFTKFTDDENWKPRETEDVAFCIWQQEKCPDTGRLHMQGYIRFKKPTRFGAVLEYFAGPGTPIHIDVARGNERQAGRDYCAKENSRVAGPWEFGTEDPMAGTKGRRTDFEEIKEKFKQGAGLRQIAEEYTSQYVMYHQGIEKMKDLVTPPPPPEREVKTLVMWGKTGTGKTHRARTMWPEIFSVEPGKWPWDSYRGQEMILFDEFDYTKWTIQQMNKFCDKWRLELDCRYNPKWAEWKGVIICANSEPYTWWPNEQQLLREAFWRRIKIVQVFSKEQEVLVTDDE